LITIKYNAEKNKNDEEINALIANAQNVESGFYLKMDNEDPPMECDDDAQRVF
jgi:hypothetical protein